MSELNLDLTIPRNRICVALDVNTLEEVEHYVKILAPYVGMFKIGFQLIHSVGGPQATKVVKDAGGEVFYDCKIKDTQDTMIKAAIDICKQGVKIFNLHASASVATMLAVRKVTGDTIVAGVTVLTSMTEEDCFHSYGEETKEKVAVFAADIANCGLQAVISAASEASIIKGTSVTSNLITITPAIRPIWAAPNDQNPDRIMTPYKAIMGGCDILVIGRPILQPPAEIGDCVKAVKLILEEVEKALKELKERDDQSRH
ncbi:MAG: orotidine-5'-phosphate decarboxylase [Candidatus Pacebacteria bacterium]|nr:orotidine-5'-phosphate decarboxylase [Candidatus Paceibacterota bacterium]